MTKESKPCLPGCEKVYRDPHTVAHALGCMNIKQELSSLRAELAQAKDEIAKMTAKWGDGSSWIPEAVLRAERASKLDEIRVRDAVISEYAATTAGLREDLYREATDNVKLYTELVAERSRADSLDNLNDVLAAEKAAKERAEAELRESTSALNYQTENARVFLELSQKAESRVKELEDLIVLLTGKPCPGSDACTHADCVEARAILANREKEQSK